MSQFHLSLPGNVQALLTSDRDLRFDAKAEALLHAYLPGARLRAEPFSPPDLVVRHVESLVPEAVCDGDTVTIHDAWNGEIAMDGFYAIYGLFRRLLLERHVFCVHAACVGDGDYVLLAGPSGTGKTTLTLRLLRDFGWRLFSGNKTVVTFDADDSLIATAGTQTTTIRLVDRDQHGPLIGSGIAYGTRYAFFLDPAFQAREASVRIRAIVLPRLNDGVEECVRLSPLSALHTLYPSFLDAVNADIVLCGGRAVLPGTPPSGTQEWLASALARVTQRIPVYAIAGSPVFVTETIVTL